MTARPGTETGVRVALVLFGQGKRGGEGEPNPHGKRAGSVVYKTCGLGGAEIRARARNRL